MREALTESAVANIPPPSGIIVAEGGRRFKRQSPGLCASPDGRFIPTNG